MVVLAILVAVLAGKLDVLLGIKNFRNATTFASGGTIFLIGAILRLWATLLFYKRNMKVLSLHPHKGLISHGLYRISRNPLLLGIVCLFFGSALLVGSLSALVFSILVFITFDLWARIEERQLELTFGNPYLQYKKEVPRWIKFGIKTKGE